MALTSRCANGNAQSLNGLVNGDVISRDKQGVSAYAAPLFGGSVLRCHA